MEGQLNETNTRTRMNVSLSAKGFGQWDCTCEYDTPERTVEELSKAIDMLRNLLKEKGIPEAGNVA